MTVLDVPPQVYYQAARDLATLTGDINSAVARDLVAALGNSAGMAGNYPMVMGWCAAYHKNVGELRTMMLAYSAALRHFGDILNSAGYNWDAAEYNANPSPEKGEPPPHPAALAATPMSAQEFPEVPNPNGDNGAGLVIASSGGEDSWTGAPNGRADALDAAATAWETFALSAELLKSKGKLQAVKDSFAGVIAPEAEDIREALDVLRGGAEQIQTAAESIGSAIRLHSDNLVDARKDLSDAAPSAFPNQKFALVTTATGNASVRASVNAELGAFDAAYAKQFFNLTLQSSLLFHNLSDVGYGGKGLIDSNAFSNELKLIALSQLPLIAETGDEHTNEKFIDELDNTVSWLTPMGSLTAVDLSKLDAYGPQMKSWAILAVKYGNEAGVDPRLVLAMVMQEGAPLNAGWMGQAFHDQIQGDPSQYKPNALGPLLGMEYDLQRARATRLAQAFPFLAQYLDKHGGDTGNSIGLTNLKEAPFLEVTTKYKDKFNGESWENLIGNDELAIKVAAYNLKMLDVDAAPQATPEVRAAQPLNQFLGSGYNASGITARSVEVATGGAPFLDNETEHGQSTVNVFNVANKILCESGAYR